MSLYGTSTPTRDPLPSDTHICDRCGVKVIRNADRWKGYCRDCKPYAKADGLMEEAA